MGDVEIIEQSETYRYIMSELMCTSIFAQDKQLEVLTKKLIDLGEEPEELLVRFIFFSLLNVFMCILSCVVFKMELIW